MFVTDYNLCRLKLQKKSSKLLRKSKKLYSTTHTTIHHNTDADHDKLHYLWDTKAMCSMINTVCVLLYMYVCILSYLPVSKIQGWVAQSVQRLATGWTVQGSNPGVGETFLTLPDRPWGLPSLLYDGLRVFYPGIQRLECGVHHPCPVKRRG